MNKKNNVFLLEHKKKTSLIVKKFKQISSKLVKEHASKIKQHFINQKQIIAKNEVEKPTINSVLNKIFISDVVIDKNKKHTIIVSKILKEFKNFDLSITDVDVIMNKIQQQGIILTGSIKNAQIGTNNFLFTKINEILIKQKEGKKKNTDALLHVFAKSINFAKVLSLEEERKALKQLSDPNEEVRKYARKKLINYNLRLVASIAKSYTNKGIELIDLIQEGISGLNIAIDKFDTSKNLKFSTYATWWVRQSITRLTSDQNKLIRIPIHKNAAINFINKIENELVNTLGHQPNIKELATAIYESKNENFVHNEKKKSTKSNIKDKINNIIEEIIILKNLTVTPTSLEKTTNLDDDTQVSDFIKDDTILPADKYFVNNETNATIYRVLQNLLSLDDEKKIWAKIISLRNGFPIVINNITYSTPLSYDEISKIISLPKEDIKKIDEKAIQYFKSLPEINAIKENWNNEQ